MSKKSTMSIGSDMKKVLKSELMFVKTLLMRGNICQAIVKIEYITAKMYENKSNFGRING
ncbi:hypothetical protein HOF46_02625 [Candidatus Woesearchaeota archaeon]|jgi:hypothetical protein|nr:hypothetical protein [Candidatus Woesearchaeota archaeon]